MESFSTPRYIEKTGRLPHHQMPAPNLLRRHVADQQVSTKSHAATPGINKHSSLGRLTPCPEKNKQTNKKPE
jgi:hypothetical protein